jgi:PKD repeat protein
MEGNMFHYKNKIFTTKFFLAILIVILLTPLQGFGAEKEMRVNRNTSVSVPIVLGQQTAIEGADIEITGYDPAVAELTDATLTGGILQSRGYTLKKSISDDKIALIIYAQSDLFTGSGNLAFLSFSIKTEGTATLSLSIFEINESFVSGGFEIEGSVYDSLKILINQPPSAEDSSLETDEDNAITGLLIAKDPDEDDLIYSISSEPVKGSVEITNTGTGAFTYTPNENENGGDSFSFKVDDGLAESDPAVVTVSIAPINDAPILDAARAPMLAQIIGYHTNNAGETVSKIVADDSVTDADGSPTESIAVTAVDNTNGTWEYSIGGSIWNAFTSEAGTQSDISAQARLLDQTHKIRFVPSDIYWGGTATFTFRAWDKTSGEAGGTADATTGGGSSAFSELSDQAGITVIATNHPPELDDSKNPQLSPIPEDDFENNGTAVAEIVADGSITDEDSDPAPEAIAVFAVDNTNGEWQYSINNGGTWIAFVVSEQAARLLDGSLTEAKTYRIRFVPNEDWSGTATFTFCAWDKSSGKAGETADISNLGDYPAFSETRDTASIEVVSNNIAPELDASHNPRLSSVVQNNFENQGNTVAEIVADGSITDADTETPPESIAVISIDNTNGNWEYSADSGATWESFSDEINNVSLPLAVLLDENSRIRFVPAEGYIGASSFRFRAWDQDIGTSGGAANAETGGGNSAFSETADDANIRIVPSNIAPVLDETAVFELSPIFQDEFANSGNSVAEILGQDVITDPDIEDGELVPNSIAVISVDNTGGMWQYSLDAGETWNDFTEHTGSETDISGDAVLLDGMHRIRFLPDGDYLGTANFTFRAWDKTSGESGQTADAGNGGGSSPFSLAVGEASLEILPANHAPVLDGDQSPELSPIPASDFDSEGNRVAEIVTDGSITDEDTDDPPEAIAVTWVNNTNGFWQYSLNDGETWTNFTEESDKIDIASEALLLDESHKIRFVPNDGWDGGTSAFILRAWDKSRGKAGETANATEGGGILPFSDATKRAVIEVLPPNHSPVLDHTQSPKLRAVGIDDTANNGNSVGDMIVNGSITDADIPEGETAPEAIAVISVDNTNGTWQYYTGTGNWADFASETGGLANISENARLLDSTHRIRFIPDKGWSGTAAITFRAWDKTKGEAGGTADATEGGNRSAFSKDTDEADIRVTDDPVANAGNDQTVFENTLVTLDGSGSAGAIVVYRWEQTEGPAAELSDPMAVQPYFTAPELSEGSISLSFTLTADDGKELISSDSVTITIMDTPPPRAAFEISPPNGTVPLTVSFKDISEGEISEWLWDFGDGRQSSEQNPEHWYAKSGTYSVSLTVKGPGGTDTDIKADSVVVKKAPFSVDFKAEPTKGAAPLSVTFTHALQGEIETWMWDFGDGKTSTAAEPVHVYENPGKYSVSLAVTGTDGTVKTETKEGFINVTKRNISGTVTAEDTGAGIKNCRVEVWSRNELKGSAETDNNGEYKVKDLPGSDNLIVAAKPATAILSYLPQFYNGKNSRITANPISTLNGNLTDINFVLKKIPPAGMTGRVHDGKNGIPGIEVNIFSERAVFGVNVQTDQNGNYTAEGLIPADDYRISVYAEEFNAEFYYALPEGGIPGQDVPHYSVFSTQYATYVTPHDPPVEHIDIIVNADQGEKIQGHVYTADGDPLAKIWVNAWSDGLNNGNAGRSDETGAYTIWGLEDVRADEVETKGYVVDIQSPDYPYQVYDRENNREEATLVPSGSKNIDFYLQTGYTISGRVRDEDGDRLSDVDIRAWSLSEPSEKSGSSVSDESGRYAVSNLPVGKDYIVAAYSQDYPVQYYRLTADKNMALPVDITAGDASDIDFALTKGSLIRGIVYIENEPAPEGAVVNIWSETLRDGGDVQTDETGRYELGGLNSDAADYVISVRHPGYVPGFYHEDGTVYQWENAARVSPSKEDRNIVLISGFSIRGLITDNDKPVAGIRAEALETADQASGNTVSFEPPQLSETLGEYNYLIEGLLPGIYQVSIYPDDFTDETQTAVITDADISLDFALEEEPERSISGTLTGLEAEKSARLRASSVLRNFVKSVTLKGTGEPLTYALGRLKPASDYVVELISDDYPYQVYNGKYRLKDANHVDISSDDAAGIDFVLNLEAAAISGEVVFPQDASPGDTARISVFSRDTDISKNVTVSFSDANTVSYRLTGLIPAADYIVYISSDKYISHYYDGTETGTTDEGDALSVDTSEIRDKTVNFWLTKGTGISGKVTDGTGEGVAGIDIEAWSKITGAYGSTVTSADGTYKIGGLIPVADYKVGAGNSERGWFFYNSKETVRDRYLGTAVSTVEGDAEGIDIRLTEVESISGQVTDRDGFPLGLMWVDAYSELQQAGNGMFTDEEGRYEIKGLPESRDYKVSARPDWFTVPVVKTDVPSGSIGINFILNPDSGYAITGIVTDSEGMPVPDVTVEAWSAFYGIRGHIWSVTDLAGRYTLKGLPMGDDYVILARPLKGSRYSFYSEKGGAIPSDSETIDIRLTEGVSISGTVTNEETGEPIRDAQVAVSSEGNYFSGDAVTDKSGFYSIGNMPEASDYEIFVMAPGYLGQRKANQSPGAGANVSLKRAGSLTGTVKDKITGELLEGAIVEAYSTSMQGLSDFSGVGITNKEGRYVINALRSSDPDDTPLSDYVIIVSANGYPLLSKGARRVGDKVDFILERGPENEIHGVIAGPDGELYEELDLMAEIFRQEDGHYRGFVFADSDGGFTFEGLNPENQYLLKFTAFRGDDEVLIQWAAQGQTGEYDQGLENPADPDEIPEGAKAYGTDTNILFRFSSSPGLRSARRSQVRSTDERKPSQISSPTHQGEIASNDPNITVTWEPSESGYDESYYYVFNPVSDYEITKRNAPQMLPVTTRKVTSAELAGDNVLHYFHVAAVDDRGKIGPTGSRSFRIDTEPPVNGAVIVPETVSASVITMIMGVTDGKENYISNTGYGQGGRWETRVKDSQWKITEGDGTKTIYVQFRDEAKNTANYLVKTEKVSEPEGPNFHAADQQFSVDENRVRGMLVGKIAVSGSAEGLTYQIIPGNTNNAFALDSDTGELTVAGVLDYETLADYTLDIEISDGTDSIAVTITITVQDVDEDRLTVNDQRFSLDENSPAGTSVGKVAASSPNQNLTYGITAGNAGQVFVIDPNTGEITVNEGAELDYETVSRYILTVEVSDGTDIVSAMISVSLGDVDETSPNEPPSAEDETFSVEENSIRGTYVGTFTASDPDSDPLIYAITAGDPNSTFAMDADTGDITVNDGTQLDYESVSVYMLTAEISDGRDSVTATITIQIADVNEDTLAVKDQTFSVDENSPAGTSLGKLVATGPDPVIAYTVVGQEPNAAFTINSSGEIFVNEGAQLDYETESLYILNVEISDGTDTVTATITIEINDVEEILPNSPPVVQDAVFEAEENSIRETYVGTVAATDPDSDSLTYRIVAGDPNGAFAIDANTGDITVNDGTQLDYETIPVYTLTIEVSDGTDRLNAVITINLTDVDENRLIVKDQTFSADENSPGGTVVGKVVASGPISERVYRILEGNSDGIFAIHRDTGEITVNAGAQIDYETASLYKLTVEVSDGTDTLTAVITITVNDVSEGGLTVKDQSFSLDENSPDGTGIGKVTASGADILRYRITEGNTDAAFAIDEATGEITVNDSRQLDYDITPVYSLRVEVSDGITSASAAITINIVQVQEEIILTNTDWQWQNPYPTGNTLKSLWGMGDSLFAAGEAGTILRYDGTTWMPMSGGTENSLNKIWGTSESNIFAAGHRGTILHYDGANWEPMKSGISENLKAIWGTSDSVLFAAGDSGTILRYDGTDWLLVDSGTEDNLCAVWGYGDSLFAAGENGTLLHYDGTEWNSADAGISEKLNGIWGSSAWDVFAVGDAGIILHYDGIGWNAVNSGTSENLTGIWGTSGEVIVTGAYGTILHYDGTRWTAMKSDTAEWLYDVRGAAGSDIFAVGHYGTILRYDGANWKQINTGTREWLKSVWGTSESDMFAVGGGFDYETSRYYTVILRNEGTGWHEMNADSAEFLYDIWGTSGSDVFAAGWGGTILHYDGTNWHQMDSGTSENLWRIAGTSGSDMFAAGDSGTVLHYDGTKWSKLETGTSEHLYGIWANSASDVFAAGDNGTILHYDGTAWQQADSGTSECFYGIWGSSGSDMFAAGDSGTILHYNATGWSLMESGVSEGFKDTWGIAGGPVFVAGDKGTVLYYSRAKWYKINSGTGASLKSLWGTPDVIFAVGDTGTIVSLPVIIGEQ